MPEWSQLAYVALLWAVFGLGCSVATQITKIPIKVLWKQRIDRERLKGAHLALYNWVIRTIPIVTGGAGGALPGVWPPWVNPVWCVVLGTTAGLMSVGLYHGLSAVLPKLFSVLPEALRKRLGGD